MTMRQDTAAGVAAPAAPPTLEGQGLSVCRRPVDPGRPIDYASFMPCSLVEGVTTDRGHVAGYEAGYADGQRDAEAAAMEAERESIARIEQRGLRAAPFGGCSTARPTRIGRPSSRARCLDSPSICWRSCSGGNRCSPSIPAARPSPGRSPWRRARFPPSPGSLPTMQTRSGNLPISGLPAHSTVVADPTVEPGGALVEVGSTTIDSQLSRALERVRAVIVGQPEEVAR